MQYSRLAGVALMLCSGCSPAPMPTAWPHSQRAVRVNEAIAYASDQVIALLRETLEVDAPDGRAVVGAVQLVPWAGDSDRFVFQATLLQPVAPGPWSLRSLAKGNVDMRTRRVEVTGRLPITEDLASSFVRHGGTLPVVTPDGRAQRAGGMGRLNTK
jgi:hypothetical protein